MSILIKGMEMPKNCASCPYIERDWNRPKCHAKSQQGRNLPRTKLHECRVDWCPLVYVPERHAPNDKLLEDAGFEL